MNQTIEHVTHLVILCIFWKGCFLRDVDDIFFYYVHNRLKLNYVNLGGYRGCISVSKAKMKMYVCIAMQCNILITSFSKTVMEIPQGESQT